MKNTVKKSVLTLCAMIAFSLSANAAVGYIDYVKLIDSYPLAQKYKKELDTKASNLKTYLDQKESEMKKATDANSQKTIREAALKEVDKRQKDYVAVKEAREKEIDTKIKAAAEKVRVGKKLEMIIKYDAVVSGGVNCTQDVLNNLK